MDLDDILEIVEEEKKRIKRISDRISQEIKLEDVLDKLKGKIPEQNPVSLMFKFSLNKYSIFVLNNKLHVGYGDLINMEFSGEEVKEYYEELDKEYKKIQKKENMR